MISKRIESHVIPEDNEDSNDSSGVFLLVSFYFCAFTLRFYEFIVFIVFMVFSSFIHSFKTLACLLGG